jgi:hypothetical protein
MDMDRSDFHIELHDSVMMGAYGFCLDDQGEVRSALGVSAGGRVVLLYPQFTNHRFDGWQLEHGFKLASRQWDAIWKEFCDRVANSPWRFGCD